MSVLLDFRLPDLGEGLTESEIVNWHVGVGDTVTLNQVIAEVETAKAIVELPSPYAGIVARLYAEPGVVINVGEPIVSFEVEGGAAADAGDRSTDAGAAAPQPNLVGYGARAESGTPQRRARRGPEAPATAPAAPLSSASASASASASSSPSSTVPMPAPTVAMPAPGSRAPISRQSAHGPLRPCASWRTISASTLRSSRARANTA